MLRKYSPARETLWHRGGTERNHRCAPRATSPWHVGFRAAYTSWFHSVSTSLCRFDHKRNSPAAALNDDREKLYNSKALRHRSSLSSAGHAGKKGPREVALFHALGSTWTVRLLAVSPRLRGSNPYPCGSLTYRSGSRGWRTNLLLALYARVHALSILCPKYLPVSNHVGRKCARPSRPLAPYGRRVRRGRPDRGSPAYPPV